MTSFLSISAAVAVAELIYLIINRGILLYIRIRRQAHMLPADNNHNKTQNILLHFVEKMP